MTKFLKFYKAAIVLLIICVVTSVIARPIVLQRIPVALFPEFWAPVRVHKIAKDIAKNMPEKKLALTMVPIFAIEGNCEIYPELSCGSFVYRIGDLLSEQEQKITHTIGQEKLPELLSANPPSIVITNAKVDTYDKTIIDSVEIVNWRKKEYENGPIVYFRE